MTPASGSINLLEQLTELREMFTFTSLLEAMIKDTDEQVHRARSERALSKHRGFCLHGVGVYHLPSVDVFTDLEVL